MITIGLHNESYDKVLARNMEQCELQIRQLVSSGTTYKRISEPLQVAKLSERSVRRFCERKGTIQEVGNGYGRMMHSFRICM